MTSLSERDAPQPANYDSEEFTAMEKAREVAHEKYPTASKNASVEFIHAMARIGFRAGVEASGLSTSNNAPQAQAKPLVWVRDVAETNFGEYYLATDPRDGVTGLVIRATARVHLGVYRSAGEAKAVAQADFEKRILACLELGASDVP